MRKGGYVSRRETGPLDVVVIATGSEVSLAVDAANRPAGRDIQVRVVSMPSTYAFERQDAVYKAEVLPSGVHRISVEAGVTDYWRKYVGLDGERLGIDTFGESAPAEALFEYFYLTAEALVDTAVRAIAKQVRSAPHRAGTR
jgi:transketolase